MRIFSYCEFKIAMYQKVPSIMSDQCDIDSVDNQRRRDLGLQVPSVLMETLVECYRITFCVKPALGRLLATRFRGCCGNTKILARSPASNRGVLTLGGCGLNLRVHVGAALSEFRRGNSGSYPARLSVLRPSAALNATSRITGKAIESQRLRQVS